jgi:hypothetical protein
VAGEDLLDVAVHLAGHPPLVGELDLRALRDLERDVEGHRHRDDRDEREQRADRQHHDQHTEDREHRPHDLREALLERRGDVVDVIRHLRDHVAARRVVEEAQREPPELAIDVLAQPEHRPLRDPRHQVLLRPPERRADQVDDREGREDPSDPRVVHARARVELHPREHLGQLVVALRAQPVDHLLLRGALGQLLVDHALEQHVRGVAEELRAEDREHHAERAEQDDRQ